MQGFILFSHSLLYSINIHKVSAMWLYSSERMGFKSPIDYIVQDFQYLNINKKQKQTCNVPEAYDKHVPNLLWEGRSQSSSSGFPEMQSQ